MRRTKVDLGQMLPTRRRRPPSNPAETARSDASLQAIWDVVAMIPRGQVRTYGEVARLAGLPGRARHAGYALRMTPSDLHLPWHRVVGAGGRIVFPKGSRAYREQGRRLRSEGVEVTDGRVAPSALIG